MANLTYSKFFNRQSEKTIAYLLAIPILILYGIDALTSDVIYGFNVHKNRMFWLTSIVALIYVFISYGLCVLPIFKKKNRSKKIIIILANSVLIPIGLYIYKIIPATVTFWNLMILIFWAYFIMFSFLIIRYKILGFQFKLEHVEDNRVQQWMNQLSEAEKVVFSYIINGKTKREIADLESKSISTVRNQISSIYKKLGITSRDDLIDELNS